MRLGLVSTAVLATCLATSTLAADLPVRAAPVVYAPVFTWAGLYVGLNAGVGWADAGNVLVTGPGGASAILGGGNSDGRFVGGGQIGYNWQSGAFVYGLETDIQYVDTGGGNVPWGPYTWWAGRGGDDGGYFGTVRVRLGYAIDRTLIYITGGLAYGGLNSNPLTGNTTSNTGWTIGGGVEYAITNNWTIKLEGLYVDTGDGRRHREFVNGPGGVLPAGTYTATSDGDGSGGVIRVGVNYKF